MKRVHKFRRSTGNKTRINFFQIPIIQSPQSAIWKIAFQSRQILLTTVRKTWHPPATLNMLTAASLSKNLLHIHGSYLFPPPKYQNVRLPFHTIYSIFHAIDGLFGEKSEPKQKNICLPTRRDTREVLPNVYNHHDISQSIQR